MSILIRELTEYEKDSDEQCRRCKGNCSFEGMGGTWQCYGFVPKTNADRIRSMSDEELAEWLERNCDCTPNCMAMTPYCSRSEKDCVQAWKIWLRQECAEAEEDDNGV